ncbi:prepilin peptidase [Candidatus Saccharibacteria bacterium]|nr:prepilin peptidase [Candidatus Saccharibacteria bacterium]
MQVIFLIFLFLLGACLGSFACCQARRLRAKEKNRKIDSKWSVCESCKKRLKWYENIPLFSWLAQKGRCRKCRQKIGRAEFLSELGLGLAFLALGFKFYPSLADTTSPLPYFSLVALIVLFTSLTICFIYDALWSSFPAKILYLQIPLALLYLLFDYLSGAKIELWSLAAGLGILPGVYYLLSLLSKEQLVGSGDWLLCLPLALVLHDFWLCFFLLFFANFLAALVNLPLAKKRHQFPFGPFLLLAFLAVYFFSAPLLSLIPPL